MTPNLSSILHDHSLLAWNNAFLAVGGRDYTIADLTFKGQHVTLYDPATNLCSPMPSLLKKREQPAVATDGILVYAFGGDRDDQKNLNCTAEVYDPSEKVWTELPPLLPPYTPWPREQRLQAVFCGGLFYLLWFQFKHPDQIDEDDEEEPHTLEYRVDVFDPAQMVWHRQLDREHYQRRGDAEPLLLVVKDHVYVLLDDRHHVCADTKKQVTIHRMRAIDAATDEDEPESPREESPSEDTPSEAILVFEDGRAVPDFKIADLPPELLGDTLVFENPRFIVRLVRGIAT